MLYPPQLTFYTHHRTTNKTTLLKDHGLLTASAPVPFALTSLGSTHPRNYTQHKATLTVKQLTSDVAGLLSSTLKRWQ